jgi:hypothetical protein
MRPVVALPAAGIVGIALWKILSILLLPLAGALIGFLLMILKVGLLVALVLFALWLFRRKDAGGEAPAE